MFGEEGTNAAQMLGINVGGVVGQGHIGHESEEDGAAADINEGRRTGGSQSLRGNSKKGKKKPTGYKGKVFNNFMSEK